MPHSRFPLAGSFVAVALLWATSASAQTGSLFRSTTPTAPRVGGYPNTGYPGAASPPSGFGGTGFGGTPTGFGGTSGGFGGTSGGFGGMSGFSTPTFGTPGFGTQPGAAGAGFGGTTAGFGARGAATGAYPGAMPFGQTPYGTAGFGTTGRLGTTGFGTTGLGATGFGAAGRFGASAQQRSAANQATAATNETTGVRIRPQVAFEYPERPATAVSSSLQTQLERISRRGPDFAGIRLELEEDGDVILRGSVPSEQAKRLAAALVRLEPGVRSVRNELTVTPAP